MTRSRGNAHQDQRRTTGELRVEGSDELTFRRLSTLSTGLGQ
jgi:hypothetical protein